MRPIENLRTHEKLTMLFETFDRVALLSVEQEVIFLKYATLPDIGTLPQSAEVSHKYLQIQDGDIVITNDPYSGGTVLTSPTLVMGIGTKNVKGVAAAEFLVAYRFMLAPRAAPAKTIDEEGLRIPPSPLYIRGESNKAIVEALRTHPSTPQGLLDSVETAAKKLLQFRQEFKRQLVSGELALSKANIKNYLSDSEEELAKRIEEYREGAGSIEMQVSANETLKLRIEHHEGHFLFDFSGTTQGSTLFMTDSATFGAAIGTILSLLNIDAPINSGIMHRFEIKAPRGSMVNATFPRQLYLGHTDGINLVANAIAMCAAQIDSRLGWAASGAALCSYELRFKSGSGSAQKIFWDALPTGGGATAKTNGADGTYVWFRMSLMASIESVESHYPIQFKNVGFRANSGGAGQHTGGRGVAKTLRVLEPAELAWQFVAPPHKPEGLNGGKSALGPEMILISADGTQTQLPPSGTMTLSRGDELTILSPGGGGYG